MNLDQILGLVRTLLASGGPVAGLLTIYGYPQDKAALWLGLALAIVPPAVAAVWGILNKTDKAIVTTVGAMPGVEVKVAPNAPAGAQAAAADPTVPGVNLKT